MTIPNWANRTIFTGDNLDVMRGMNSASVDLIYLDPPFNSNRDYEAPVGSPAAGAAFKDAWTMNDVKAAEHGEVADRNPALYKVIDAAGAAHGKSMMAYLIMMGVRLLEMRRLLNLTGSIYLHCDTTAGHYLKLLMDAVFGNENFRNQVVWKRTETKGLASQRFPRNHDLLLSYSRSGDTQWNSDETFIPYDYGNLDEKTLKQYKYVDDDGRRYTLDNLANPNRNRPNLTYEFLGVTRVWRWTRERMHKAWEEGLIVQAAPGRVPRYKRYLDEQRGIPLVDVWTDISPPGARSNERLGYPTQKPLALLERIIRVSSKQGDVVLDPFCGCATACVASEDLKRQWVGIDLSSKAAELVIQRFSGTKQLTLLANRIIHRTDIPRRTDLGKLSNYRTHKHTLFGQQEGLCEGCCHPFPFRNFTIDHIVAQSRGGTDHLGNLQLLCNACNSMKGTRSQAEFRAELKRIGITGT